MSMEEKLWRSQISFDVRQGASFTQSKERVLQTALLTAYTCVHYMKYFEMFNFCR